nr:Toll/interleukin-1 receptor (TIR) domain-containing protein [Tanacetum cinerariifolium]
MSTSGLEACRNFLRCSCTYEARCKFVHGTNDLRSLPNPNLATRSNNTMQTRGLQTQSNTNPRPTIATHQRGQPTSAPSASPQPMYPAQPTNTGYVYFHTGLGSYPCAPLQQPVHAYLGSTTYSPQQVSAHHPVLAVQQYPIGPLDPTIFYTNSVVP